MGQRGTEVARESATLVLLDDNFATIVAAVRDGRLIFDNLMRAFGYLIAFHPPLLFGALGIPLLNQPLLFLPVHLIVLELLLHPVVSLVFQADPADPDVMHRPPRPSPPLSDCASCGGRTLSVPRWLRASSPSTSPRSGSAGPSNRPVPSGSSRSWPASRSSCSRRAAPTVTDAVVYIPPLADLLQLAPFPLVGWGVVLAVAALATLWSEPLKRHPS